MTKWFTVALLVLSLLIPTQGRAATLTIDPSVVAISVGVKFFLRALSDGTDVGLDSSWGSSDNHVADIDQRGEIEGRSPGTVTITVEHQGNVATATVSVVTEGSPPPLLPPPLLPPPLLPPPPSGYEGFGATTPGGTGQPVYRVTTLADSGTGSLRDAISQGNRHIVFDVAGTIVAGSALQVRGAFVTIDGLTAPDPGIMITNRGLQIRGSLGAHDVIVRGLRVRNANASSSTDCIQISHGAFNIVVDHVSVSGCGDGGIDINGDPNNPDAPPTRDVTVSWSILGPPVGRERGMLIKYGTTRLTLHHNLFVDTDTRIPEVTRETLPPDTETTLDMRNNMIWNWRGGYGTRIHAGVNANVVANLYGNPSSGTTDDLQGLVICRGDGVETPPTFALCNNGAASERAQGFASGNLSVDGVNLNAMSNAPGPFAAPAVTITDACTAGMQILADAGAPFRDQTDESLTAINPGCAK